MAYDIFYYRRTANSVTRLPDFDKVSDLPKVPAIDNGEVAFASNPIDVTLSRWGYAGAWHKRPPPEWEAE